MTPSNSVDPISPIDPAKSKLNAAAAMTCHTPSDPGTRQPANPFTVEESFVVASFQTALGHLSAAEVFARRTYGAHNPATEALRSLELQKKALLALLAGDHSNT